MSSLVQRLKHKAKWAFNDGLYSLGLKSVSTNSTEKRILVYHGVVPNATTKINGRFISTKEFEQHLQFFTQHFNIVSLQDYLEGNHNNDRLTLTLTFDDGYLNNLTEVLPLLEKYNVPATFYITTIRDAGYDTLWADALDLHRFTGPAIFPFDGKNYKNGRHEYEFGGTSLKQKLKSTGWEEKKALLDIITLYNNYSNKEHFAPYHQLLDENDILKLSQSELVEIGSHGYYHNCLGLIDEHLAINELGKSKKYLENIIQKPVTSLAYPDGSYTRSLIKRAETIGYTNQMLVDYEFSEDKADARVFDRFGINPFISFNNQMQAIVDGKY